VKTVSNSVNQQIIDSHRVVVLDLYRKDKKKRIAFLRALFPLYNDLLIVGNDKSGAVQVITQLLREERPHINSPSVREYVYAARTVHAIDNNEYEHLGLYSADEIDGAYQHIWKLPMQMEATLVKRASQSPEPKPESTWEGITASLYESIAQAYIKAAKELRDA
jgi:hypothetical protein